MTLHSRSVRWLAAAGILLAASVPVSAAYADAVFHSARYELSAVGGAPLASGFVIDIHANGPRVYAQERYQLRGAVPATEYQVTLLAYADTACTQFIQPIPETTMTTDAQGNTHGSVTFTPESVAAFRNPTGTATYGLTWVIGPKGESPAYTTGCQAVSLD
jgi:hypothetical protein